MSRRKPGKENLEEALLNLLKTKRLQEISVSKLCERAHVSRSTFYAYYSNVDSIYCELVRELANGTINLKRQLKGEIDVSRRPFCENIRDEKFSGLVKEERFMQTYLSVCMEEIDSGVANDYLDMTKSQYAAKVISLFQLTGCLAVAKTSKDDALWPLARKVVDTFIRGGMNALRSVDWEEERGAGRTEGEQGT